MAEEKPKSEKMEKTEAKKEEEEKKVEVKGIAGQAEKKKTKLSAKIVKPKEIKHEALVRGVNLPISTKHAIAICRFIKDKGIAEAILQLEGVIKKKKAIPFRGEIPHRRGMHSGRYPVKAAKQFIKMLRNLNANASINGLDLDKIRISAKTDVATRRRFSRKYKRFKRSNVLLIAKEIHKEVQEEKGIIKPKSENKVLEKV